MTQSQAISGSGTKLLMNGVQVGELMSLDPPTKSRNVQRVLRKGNPGYKHYIGAMRESGELSLGMNFTRAKYDYFLRLFERNYYVDFSIIVPDTTIHLFDFKGIVKDISIINQSGNVIKCNATVKVSGKIEVNLPPPPPPPPPKSGEIEPGKYAKKEFSGGSILEDGYTLTFRAKLMYPDTNGMFFHFLQDWRSSLSFIEYQRYPNTISMARITDSGLPSYLIIDDIDVNTLTTFEIKCFPSGSKFRLQLFVNGQFKYSYPLWEHIPFNSIYLGLSIDMETKSMLGANGAIFESFVLKNNVGTILIDLDCTSPQQSNIITDVSGNNNHFTILNF